MIIAMNYTFKDFYSFLGVVLKVHIDSFEACVCIHESKS